jgi:hypothetical protein
VYQGGLNSISKGYKLSMHQGKNPSSSAPVGDPYSAVMDFKFTRTFRSCIRFIFGFEKVPEPFGSVYLWFSQVWFFFVYAGLIFLFSVAVFRGFLGCLYLNF